MTDTAPIRPAGARVWLDAARPRTLGAAVGPVLLGAAFAVDAGGAHFPSLLAALACALLLQVAANFANDYYDFLKGADTAARVGPVRATASGLVTPAQMRRALALTLAAAFLLGLYLVWRGGWPILVIGLLSMLFAVLYTGGPYPLGYLGLGEVFVFLFFGPVAVAGTAYVQTLSFDPLAAVAGIGPGLFSVAILTVNNLRDRDEDSRTGKRTLAVRFGARFARAEYALSLLVALLGVPALLCALPGGHGGTFAALPVLVPAAFAVRTVSRESGPSLNRMLGGTGKLLLLYSLLFGAGWMLW